jgi:hypothetical protein
MDTHSERAVTQYAYAYQQLYKRTPSDIRFLDNGWVSINGAKMHVTELEFLTQQLQQEYNQTIKQQRRSIVERLMTFFKQ